MMLENRAMTPDDDRPVELNDTDLGWGDWREAESDDSHLLENRPPHW